MLDSVFPFQLPHWIIPWIFSDQTFRRICKLVFQTIYESSLPKKENKKVKDLSPILN